LGFEKRQPKNSEACGQGASRFLKAWPWLGKKAEPAASKYREYSDAFSI
jgi:hypothetical protein